METATISQLKNGLSAYLKRVRRGETVLILDRDEPIAMLERIDSTEHPDSRLLRLEQSGLIRRSRTADPLKALAESTPVRANARVVEALIAERREGR